MFNIYSNIFIGANTTLNLYENLNGQGSIAFGNNATLGTMNAVSFQMASSQLGTLNLVNLATC